MENITTLLYKLGKKNHLIPPDLKEAAFTQKTETEEIEAFDLTFLNIRDALIGLGRIVEENKEEQYYFGSIQVKGSNAVSIVRLVDKKIEIAAYAKEGLIKQHLAQQAIQLFKSRLY